MHCNILITETTGFNEAQSARQLYIVAEFGVGVEWQMIGEQADIVPHQIGDTAVLHSDQARVFASPEITMMNKDGICICGYSGFAVAQTRL